MSGPTRTVVHLLRHGEVYNPTGVLYGRLPGFLLTAEGLTMAERVADVLAGPGLAYLACSPLERARQTAEPIAARSGLPVLVDERLIESTNVFEGMRVGVGDGVLRQPACWWALRNPFRPSWGEPFRSVAERVLASVASAREAATGREAVLVSHQLPIWVSRRAIEGRRLWHRPDRRQCGLASVTSFTFCDHRVVSVTYTEPAGAASRRRAVPGA